MSILQRALLSCLAIVPVLAVACGDDDGVVSNPDASEAGIVTPQNDGGTPPAPPAPPVQEYSVGGVVLGLLGSGLVLTSEGEDLPVASDGTFAFPKKRTSGANYLVSVKTQPSEPWQTCIVSGGSGAIGNGNVSTVAVSCATDSYAIGGTVAGLNGTGLELGLAQKSETLTIALPVIAGSNLDFTFTNKILSGAPYTVVIDAQPTAPAQTCRFTPGTDTGTVTSANITRVAVTCKNDLFIGGRTASGGGITGLSAGANLTLQLDGKAGSAQTFTANGNFALGPIPSGMHYKVIVVSPQPQGQTCTPSNNEGDAVASDVTNVLITCNPPNCSTANTTITTRITNQSNDTSTNQSAAGQLLNAQCCSNSYRNFISNGCSNGVGQTCSAQATCN